MWLGASQNPLLDAPDLTREVAVPPDCIQPTCNLTTPVPSPLALTPQLALWHMERPDISWLPRCLAAKLDLKRVIRRAIDSTRKFLYDSDTLSRSLGLTVDPSEEIASLTFKRSAALHPR